MPKPAPPLSPLLAAARAMRMAGHLVLGTWGLVNKKLY